MAVTAHPSLGAVNGVSNGVTKEYAVADGVTVYSKEFVYLDANGRVSSESIAGVRLLGQVVGGSSRDLDRSYSASATGNAAGTVKVLVLIDPEARYLLKNDNVATTFAATHVGDYFDLVGNAGSQLVDTSTVSTTGQLVCLEFSPGIRGTDATYGIYKIAERQLEL
jgi:hypothetical protein